MCFGSHLALRVFLLVFRFFSLHKKPTIQNFNSIGTVTDEQPPDGDERNEGPLFPFQEEDEMKVCALSQEDNESEDEGLEEVCDFNFRY